MKKIMFAAAALAAGVAMADAGLVSSDIVGYAQSNLRQGGTLATPQFVNVSGSEGMPITSLVPVGDNTYNNVAIQTLDAYGYTVDSYSWTDAGGENWDQVGWVDDSNTIVTNITFAPGQALWVQGSSLSQGLQTAGKVGTSDVSVQLRQGGTLAGNPFPVNITIGDLVPTGDNTYNNVAVQTLDAYGYTVDSYSWTDAGGETWDQVGWVDDANTIVTDVVISAGQGLWIQGSSTSQYLCFPAPNVN